MTKSQLIAALAIAEARISVLESKLVTARECYVKQRTKIGALEGEVANLTERAAAKPLARGVKVVTKPAWQPSARQQAAKRLAIQLGRIVRDSEVDELLAAEIDAAM